MALGPDQAIFSYPNAATCLRVTVKRSDSPWIPGFFVAIFAVVTQFGVWPVGRCDCRMEFLGRTTLQKLIEFYVDEHNIRFPHSAFRGQTPNEMYFDTGNHIPKELEASRKAARESRMEVNRTASCPTCEQRTSISSQTDPTDAAVSS